MAYKRTKLPNQLMLDFERAAEGDICSDKSAETKIGAVNVGHEFPYDNFDHGERSAYWQARDVGPYCAIPPWRGGVTDGELLSRARRNKRSSLMAGSALASELRRRDLFNYLFRTQGWPHDRNKFGPEGAVSYVTVAKLLGIGLLLAAPDDHLTLTGEKNIALNVELDKWLPSIKDRSRNFREAVLYGIQDRYEAHLTGLAVPDLVIRVKWSMEDDLVDSRVQLETACSTLYSVICTLVDRETVFEQAGLMRKRVSTYQELMPDYKSAEDYVRDCILHNNIQTFVEFSEKKCSGVYGYLRRMKWAEIVRQFLPGALRDRSGKGGYRSHQELMMGNLLLHLDIPFEVNREIEFGKKKYIADFLFQWQGKTHRIEVLMVGSYEDAHGNKELEKYWNRHIKKEEVLGHADNEMPVIFVNGHKRSRWKPADYRFFVRQIENGLKTKFDLSESDFQCLTDLNQEYKGPEAAAKKEKEKLGALQSYLRERNVSWTEFEKIAKSLATGQHKTAMSNSLGKPILTCIQRKASDDTWLVEVGRRGARPNKKFSDTRYFGFWSSLFEAICYRDKIYAIEGSAKDNTPQSILKIQGFSISYGYGRIVSHGGGSQNVRSVLDADCWRDALLQLVNCEVNKNRVCLRVFDQVTRESYVVTNENYSEHEGRLFEHAKKVAEDVVARVQACVPVPRPGGIQIYNITTSDGGLAWTADGERNTFCDRRSCETAFINVSDELCNRNRMLIKLAGKNYRLSIRTPREALAGLFKIAFGFAGKEALAAVDVSLTTQWIARWKGNVELIESGPITQAEKKVELATLVLSRVNDGKSPAEISRELEIPETSLARIIDQIGCGWIYSKTERYRRDPRSLAMKSMFDQCGNYSQVATAFGVSGKVVRRHIHCFD